MPAGTFSDGHGLLHSGRTRLLPGTSGRDRLAPAFHLTRSASPGSSRKKPSRPGFSSNQVSLSRELPEETGIKTGPEKFCGIPDGNSLENGGAGTDKRKNGRKLTERKTGAGPAGTERKNVRTVLLFHAIMQIAVLYSVTSLCPPLSGDGAGHCYGHICKTSGV